MTPGQFIDTVLPWIMEAGGRISSWYRPTKYNKLVGGVEDSWHIVGLAVDVVDLTPEARARLIMRSKRAGFGTLATQTYLHIQAFKTKVEGNP